MKSPKTHRKGSTPKRPFKDEKPERNEGKPSHRDKRDARPAKKEQPKIPSSFADRRDRADAPPGPHKRIPHNPREREERQGRDHERSEVRGDESRSEKGRRDAPLSERSEQNNPLRIAKRIADAGVCSRRMAERYITEGRVTLNGVVVTALGTTVTERDKVVVDGKLIANKPQEARLFLYHKPRGEIVTARDVRGRPTVFDNLPKDLPRLVSVGRLDLDSEGLLLLTTSGELARQLELPSTGHARIYRVRIYGTITEKHIHMLSRGLTVDGVQYGSIDVKEEVASDILSGNAPLSFATANARSGGVNRQRREGTESPVRASREPQQKSYSRNRWLIVTLHEGKNRELRRVFDFLGYPVNRLQRMSYGPFTLGKLPAGTLMEIKPKDWLAMLEMPLPPKAEPKPRPERKPLSSPSPVGRGRGEGSARGNTDHTTSERPARDDRPRKPRAKDKGKPKRFMRDAETTERRPPRDKRDTNEKPKRSFHRKDGDTTRPDTRKPPRDGKKEYAKSDRPFTRKRDGDEKPKRPFHRKEGDAARPDTRKPPREGTKDHTKSDRPRPPKRDGDARPARSDDRRPRRPGGKPPRR